MLSVGGAGMLETNLVDFKSLALDPSPDRKNELLKGVSSLFAFTSERCPAFDRNPVRLIPGIRIQTPGTLDGFDLARKVAARWPHICVIIASGAATPREGDMPDNANFIPKPISAKLVHDVLLEHCGSTG